MVWWCGDVATHGEEREEEGGPGGDVGGEQVVDVDSSLKIMNIIISLLYCNYVFIYCNYIIIINEKLQNMKCLSVRRYPGIIIRVAPSADPSLTLSCLTKQHCQN